MSNVGSAIISALETAYKAIQAQHPDLPSLLFITGQGFRGKRKRLGHYAHGAWRIGQDGLHEVFIAGETMHLGATETFTTILHEAVHALAEVRGVKEMRKGTKFHNKKFLKLAEELGMEYLHERPHPSIGFSDVVLKSETKELYKTDIVALEAALKAYRPENLVLAKETPPGNVKMTCGCTPKPRIIRASQKEAIGDPIVCEVCDSAFLAQAHR